MAALLASSNITTTNTDLAVYTVPTGKTASFSLSVANRTAGKVKLRIALSESSSPSLGEYLEYDAEVLPNEALKLLGLVLGEGGHVFVRSNASGVSAVVWGFVE